MKQKIKKEYIKTNIIAFILPITIIISVGVYAIVTFPSNEVSYSNGTSGLKSINVQGAIDELYKTCTQTAAEKLIEEGKLEKDQYECRYFYKGKNSNNYITFNGEQAGWRIISVECDGTIKIVKNLNIGDQYWNDKYNNDWEQSSLNDYLNETYYNSLTSAAKNQIVAKNWSIGAIGANNSRIDRQIELENSKTWNGKVALPTVSEYIRTNNGPRCSYYSLLNDNSIYCEKTTWMLSSGSSAYWWTITPDHDRDGHVFLIQRGSIIFNGVTMFSGVVKPSVYLSSEIRIVSGNGSFSNPYQLSL